MNEAYPAECDYLLEIDDNLYSLAAIIEAQFHLKTTSIDESSVIRNVIAEFSDGLAKTLEKRIAEAEDSGFLSSLTDKAVRNLHSACWGVIATRLGDLAANLLSQRKGEIEELINQTIQELISEALADNQTAINDFSQGLKASICLRRLVAGEIALPRQKAFYRSAIKEHIANYINGINSLVPANFQ